MRRFAAYADLFTTIGKDVCFCRAGLLCAFGENALAIYGGKIYNWRQISRIEKDRERMPP